MIRTTRAHTRSGFTLVELMVAAAVCVLIMAVLATAFQMGIDTMRQMKSTGDLMDQLRGATEVLRTDLKNDHFLDDGSTPPRVRVRDIRLDQLQWTPSNSMLDSNVSLPTAGFFRARSSPVVGEGTDADDLVASRATDHYLHFTTILPPGDGLEDNYTATVNGQTVKSRAAEIAYFLDGTGLTTANANLPLFRLIRRQRLVALNQTELQTRWLGVPLDPAVISVAMPTSTTYGNVPNTLADMTNPYKRLGGTVWSGGTQVGPAYGVSGPGNDSALSPLISRPGDDILLSNVISFEVQLSWSTAGTSSTIPTIGPPTAFTPGVKTDFPFDTLPSKNAGANSSAPDNVFDTWSNQLTGWNAVDTAKSTTPPNPTMAAYVTPPMFSVPYPIRVMAIQIRIRIWDPKLQNARQMTIVQDL